MPGQSYCRDFEPLGIQDRPRENVECAHRVAGLRGYHKIAPFQKQDGWVTLEEAARELQVSNTVVKRLIRECILPAKQVVKYAPWIIEKDDLLLPTVQAQVKAARRGAHKLPQIVLGQGQLSLE